MTMTGSPRVTIDATCRCGRYLEPGKQLHRNGRDCLYRQACIHHDHLRELGIVVQRNGIMAYRTRCTGCGGQRRPAAAADAANAVIAWTENSSSGVTCSVQGCDSTDVEDHHFAPRNTFPDADDWPVMPLCRHHHRIWHKTMDGYRSAAPSRIRAAAVSSAGH